MIKTSDGEAMNDKQIVEKTDAKNGDAEFFEEHREKTGNDRC